MAQSITELTTLSPNPSNYLLHYHKINEKHYFSLRNKGKNADPHFNFKSISDISINGIVFVTPEELITAFDTNFTASTAPELAPILFSHTPPVLNNGQNEIVDVAVVGAILGQGYVTLTTNLTAFQNTSINSFVIADDLVRVIIVNNTGGTINLPQLDFKYIK